jgi:hypothetical protein
MTGPEHYAEAQRLIRITTPAPCLELIMLAQAHATLAVAAATVGRRASRSRISAAGAAHGGTAGPECPA